MVDENINLNPDEDEEEIKRAEKMFEDTATTDPKRDVKVPTISKPKSFSEVEDDLGQGSDLILTLKRLFPRFPYAIVNRVCSAVMVGRILHDTMLDRVYLTVVEIMEDWDEEEDGVIHLEEIKNLVTTAYEIGLDSKGRVDSIELHGKAAESEQLEKLANRLD